MSISHIRIMGMLHIDLKIIFGDQNIYRTLPVKIFTYFKFFIQGLVWFGLFGFMAYQPL